MDDAKALLAESFARHLARARFGPGVDMGGRHNPVPSEYRIAREMVEEAEAVFSKGSFEENNGE